MKVYITISKNGKGPAMFINLPFCECKNARGLKQSINKKYDKIYNNCKNYFGSGNCLVQFTNQERIEIAKMNVNVL